MIKIDKIQVYNFDGAIRGMRNPLDSWDKSDSGWGENRREVDIYNERHFVIGEKDLKLAQTLIGAGTDDSKFMRQILISMDITAPLYWWKEADTYKVGTVANSCSTMHKLTFKPIELSDFSHDEFDIDDNYSFNDYVFRVIKDCEELRQKYLETKDKKYWRGLIQLLPESYNQKRTWTANYQVLRNIYFARKYHKLDEWQEFCKIIEDLPYGKELICFSKYQ